MSFITEFLNSSEKLSSFIGAAAAVSIPLIVNTVKDFYFDHQKRKTERNYIAVQLIFLLDDFVYNCGEVSWDQGYDSSFPEPDEHEYEAQTEDPIFDMTSVKGEYKYLEPLLLYKIQSITVEIAKAKETLREITNSPNFDYSDVPNYFTKRRKEYAAIGIYASNIADELRTIFKVPHRDDWNPRDTISNSIKLMNRQASDRKLKSMERRASRIMGNHRKQLAATETKKNSKG